MLRITKWSCDFLRSKFLEEDHPIEATRHIYISRKKAATRRIVNEEEVTALLSRYGFEEILMEELSVKEQSRLFASASVVVAPHGAALTNLVFCNSGTHVVEIFSPTWVIDCFWQVGHHRQLDHHVLLGESAPVNDENKSGMDITVNCEELEKMIDKILSEDQKN